MNIAGWRDVDGILGTHKVMTASLLLHSVFDEGGERRLAHSEMLELQRIGEPFEETFPSAEYHWGDDDRKLVNQPSSQGLADDLRAAHHVHPLVTGSRPGPLDHLGQASNEYEPLARWLLVGTVGDHEDRDAPGVLVTPVPGRLIGAPSGDPAPLAPRASSSQALSSPVGLPRSGES